ncbi:hypothetical protein AALK14_08195 [Butyricimonas hominis]|uniref:hypothetical protein n=1 Tax=Butyricimonas hominis TaxID=2763032 RepID=UPI003518094D
MAKPRIITEETKQIMIRFYSALDALIEKKELKGVNTYCRLYNIDRRNLLAQRKDLDRVILQISWMQPIVKDFGVSGDWLLTGRGAMFK